MSTAERPDQADAVPWTAQRVRVTAALLVAILVAAVDASIVSTAMPTIAQDLGGFSLYSWVFAGYLLTSTTTVPIWGRMADIHGRRRVLLAGLAWFAVTSLLCSAAPGMFWLAVFRTLQGIGAGCLVPVALTLIGDLFPLRQRARLQGLFGSMWVVSALLGPMVGALFVSTIGWRWIFGVNLPLGVLAAALVWSHRDHPAASEREGLHVVGALTLTAGFGALLAGLGAGSTGAQLNWPMVAVGALLLAAFVVVERRGGRPTVPLDLLRDGLIGPALAAAALAGALMFGLAAFLPLYVQGALGGSAFEAGAAIAPASIAWSLAAMIASQVLLRTGYPPLVVSGALCMVAGTAMLLAPAPLSRTLWVACASGLVGIGMGQLQTPLLIVLQGAVGWRQRGTVTALNQFARTMGGAVGVSLLGVLLEWRIGSQTSGAGAAARIQPLQPGELAAAARPLLAAALDGVFLALLCISLATLALSLGILAREHRRAAEAP